MLFFRNRSALATGFYTTVAAVRSVFCHGLQECFPAGCGFYPLFDPEKKHTTMAKCLTQRADIALLSEQRMTNWKISDKVDLPVNQVGKWRRRFLGQVERLNAVAQEKPADLEKELLTNVHGSS